MSTYGRSMERLLVLFPPWASTCPKPARRSPDRRASNLLYPKLRPPSKPSYVGTCGRFLSCGYLTIRFSHLMWLIYIMERLGSAQTTWAMIVDDSDISQLLPMSDLDFNEGVRDATFRTTSRLIFPPAGIRNRSPTTTRLT